MWTLKKFKTEAAMAAWIKKMRSRVQYDIIYINNGYAVEYRPLIIIDIQ